MEFGRRVSSEYGSDIFELDSIAEAVGGLALEFSCEGEDFRRRFEGQGSTPFLPSWDSVGWGWSRVHWRVLGMVTRIETCE